jgi:hypothetical protein
MVMVAVDEIAGDMAEKVQIYSDEYKSPQKNKH